MLTQDGKNDVGGLLGFYNVGLSYNIILNKLIGDNKPLPSRKVAREA